MLLKQVSFKYTEVSLNKNANLWWYVAAFFLFAFAYFNVALPALMLLHDILYKDILFFLFRFHSVYSTPTMHTQV